jgi:phosphohistidine phosphatase
MHNGEIAETDALSPDATPQQLWQEIRKRKSAGDLLLAGHEPHLSKSIAYLLGVPELTIDLKKGALARLDADRLNGEPHAVLKWLLTPAVC